MRQKGEWKKISLFVRWMICATLRIEHRCEWISVLEPRSLAGRNREQHFTLLTDRKMKIWSTFVAISQARRVNERIEQNLLPATSVSYQIISLFSSLFFPSHSTNQQKKNIELVIFSFLSSSATCKWSCVVYFNRNRMSDQQASRGTKLSIAITVVRLCRVVVVPWTRQRSRGSREQWDNRWLFLTFFSVPRPPNWKRLNGKIAKYSKVETQKNNCSSNENENNAEVETQENRKKQCNNSNSTNQQQINVIQCRIALHWTRQGS